MPLIYYALSGYIDAVQQLVNTALHTMAYSLDKKVNRRPGHRPVVSEALWK